MKADARRVFDTIIKGTANDEQSSVISPLSKPSSATMSDAPERIAEGIKSCPFCFVPRMAIKASPRFKRRLSVLIPEISRVGSAVQYLTSKEFIIS